MPSPRHRSDSADRGGLLALAEARARLAKHSPPNSKFVDFGYARYTRAWRLRRFSAFLNCGSGLPLFGFKFSPFQPQKGNPTPKRALWITHFFSENGGEVLGNNNKAKREKRARGESSVFLQDRYINANSTLE